jgi:hypothetical protein
MPYTRHRVSRENPSTLPPSKQDMEGRKGLKERFMQSIREILIQQAQQQYHDIYPCGRKQSFGDCFTLCNDRLIFWFNTQDNSSHVLACSLDDVVKE